MPCFIPNKAVLMGAQDGGTATLSHRAAGRQSGQAWAPSQRQAPSGSPTSRRSTSFNTMGKAVRRAVPAHLYRLCRHCPLQPQGENACDRVPCLDLS